MISLFSQYYLTCASLQTGALRLQLPADGGGLQPVEGAGSQTVQNQRRRTNWDAVVLNHHTEEEEKKTLMRIHSFKTDHINICDPIKIKAYVETHLSCSRVRLNESTSPGGFSHDAWRLLTPELLRVMVRSAMGTETRVVKV